MDTFYALSLREFNISGLIIRVNFSVFPKIALRNSKHKQNP